MDFRMIVLVVVSYYVFHNKKRGYRRQEKNMNSLVSYIYYT